MAIWYIHWSPKVCNVLLRPVYIPHRDIDGGVREEEQDKGMMRRGGGGGGLLAVIVMGMMRQFLQCTPVPSSASKSRKCLSPSAPQSFCIGN